MSQVEHGEEVTACMCVAENEKKPAKFGRHPDDPSKKLVLCADCYRQFMTPGLPMPKLCKAVPFAGN